MGDQHKGRSKTPDPRSTATARKLRRDMTYPERLLWSRLRGGRLADIKFRRQHPIPPFVVDFYCHEARLVIELDGMTHVNVGDKDSRRAKVLEAQGYTIMRVTNDEVLENVDCVAEGILLRVRQLSDSS